jgi:hypothetical protein
MADWLQQRGDTVIDEYAWLAPLLPGLERPQTATAAANQIRTRDPELDAQLRD